MGSLKEQLLKKGLKPTEAPKSPNLREQIPRKKVTEEITHQVQRNFCEACEGTYPDVELYHHNNPTTEAEWICVRCADRLKIFDTCRQTAQSDTSIRKMFRREHGATLNASDIKFQKNFKPSGPVDGNR
ncbi:MAG: hypothetical protein ACOYL6_13450 [Bacteriovoracaceae bacterium]